MTFKKTHWMTWTRFYKIWRWILNRCQNKNNNLCKNYWYRWIRCERKSFEEFKNDMYDSYIKHVKEYWEKDTTIDRIDYNWNYCKGNCRWATTKEQWNNTSTNVHIQYKWKEYKSIMLLCEELWLRYNAIYKRIFLDWQKVENAIDEVISKLNKFEYKWVKYRWITDMCRKLWLNRTSISYRLSIWMSIEDAIEKEFRPYTK